MNALAHKNSDVTDLRLSLLANGYWPLPIMRGKRPPMGGWSALRATQADIHAWEREHSSSHSTGILTGDVVAIDIDAPDPVVAEKLISRFLEIPGAAGAPCRTGKAPKCLFISRTATPREKVSTAAYMVSGHKCQVEVLGVGQQFVAFGIHDDTGKPYTWTSGDPQVVRFADLPEFPPEAIHAYLIDAESILAAAGAPLKKQKAQKKPETYTGSSVWERVSAAAFASLDSWVPHLGLAKLKRYQEGYLAVASFRPSGRAGLSDHERQEALEISPAGICDHGDSDTGYSPISLVRTCLGKSNSEALLWLCQQIGRDPSEFGWEMRVPVSVRFGAAKPRPEADNDEDGETLPAVSASTSGLAEALCYPPGAVGEFARWITSCSRFPSPHLSLAAALALTAGLIGRRYKGPTGLRSNIYIVGLAESGFGKDITIRATGALADSTSAGDKVSQALFIDEIRSLPGLAGKLRKSPSAIAVVDEFGKFLAIHTGRNVAAHREEITTALMQLTGAPQGFWGGQEKAVGNIPRIIQPCLSLHGISTPSTFWSALSSGNISEGLLGRLVLIDAGNAAPVKVRRPAASIDNVPEDLADKVNALLGGGFGRYGGGPFYALNATSETRPHPIMTVGWAPGVDDIFEDFDDEMRGLRGKIPAEYRPILNRVGENAARLALIVAVGCDPKDPVITTEIQEWANTVAKASFETMIRGADDNIADNEKSAEYLRVRTIVTRKGKEGITLKFITKTLRGAIDRRRLDDILTSLREAGEVHFAKWRSESGQVRIRFWGAEHLPEGAEVLEAGGEQ